MLAIVELYLEGLWKHALHTLFLSVMFLLCCLLFWSLFSYSALCPLCFCFVACCVCYIVGSACSIISTFPSFFTRAFCACVRFVHYASQLAAQIFFVSVTFKIRNKFSHLLFYTFMYIHLPFTPTIDFTPNFLPTFST